ncbi:hypothetical protein ABPG74_015893 [Tetrahymena malaccensis]
MNSSQQNNYYMTIFSGQKDGLTSFVNRIGQGDQKNYITIDKNDQTIKLDLQFNNKLYASKSSVIVFLFDLTSKASFDNAIKTFQSIKTILNQNKCIIFLLGNKADLYSSKQILTSDANAVAQKNNMIYLEVSSTVPIKINDFLKLLQQKIIIQKQIEVNNIPSQQTPTKNSKKSFVFNANDILQDNILNLMGKSITKQTTQIQTTQPQAVKSLDKGNVKKQEVLSIDTSIQDSARDKWQSLQNIVAQIQEDEKKYTEQIEKQYFQQQVLSQQNNFHQAALQQKQKDLTDFLLYINRQHNENQMKLQNKNRVSVKDILQNIDQIKQWNDLIQVNVIDKYQVDSFTQLTSQMMLENTFQLLQIIISKDVLPQTKINNNQNDIQQVITHLLQNQNLLQGKITADGYQKVQLFKIFMENYQLIKSIDQIQLNQFEFSKTSQFGINPIINQNLQNNGQAGQPNLEISIENNMNQVVNEQNFQYQKQLELQSSASYTHQQTSKALISTKSQTPKSFKQNAVQKLEFFPIQLKNKKFVEYFKTPQKRNQIQIEDQQIDQPVHQQRSLTPSYSSKTGYYNNKNQVKQTFVQKQALTDQKSNQQQQNHQYFYNQQNKMNLTPKKKQIQTPVKQQKFQNKSQIPQQIDQNDFIHDCEYLKQYYSFLRLMNNQNNLVQNFEMLKFLDYNPVIQLQMQNNDNLYDLALSARWWWNVQSKQDKLQNLYANLYCSQELSLDYFSYLTPLKLFQKQNLQQEEFDDSYLISNVSSLVSYKTNQFKSNDQKNHKAEEFKILNIFKKDQQNNIIPQQQQIDVNSQKWFHINNKKTITLYNHLQPFQDIERQYVEFQAQNQDKLCIPTSFIFTKENFKQQSQSFYSEFDKLDGSINQVYLDQNHQKELSQNFITNTWIVKIFDSKSDSYDHKIIYKKEDIEQLKIYFSQPKKKLQKIIVQKYIEQPLLLQKRKFTIKCFVLITSYNNHLNAYWYEDGFISTCAKNYQILDLDDVASHNTNDQKQFKTQNYGVFEKFNKMSLSEYKDAHFQIKNCTFDSTILKQMKKLATEFIQFKSQDILNDRLQFCYQVISLNFIVDKFLKVWLLSVDTKQRQDTNQNQFLYQFYNELIDQTFRYAVDPIFPPPYYAKSQYDQIPKNLTQSNKFSHFYSC